MAPEGAIFCAECIQSVFVLPTNLESEMLMIKRVALFLALFVIADPANAQQRAQGQPQWEYGILLHLTAAQTMNWETQQEAIVVYNRFGEDSVWTRWGKFLQRLSSPGSGDPGENYEAEYSPMPRVFSYRQPRIQEAANALGRQGWELFHIAAEERQRGRAITYWFKRTRQDGDR